MKYFHYSIIYFFGATSYFITVVENDNQGKIIGGIEAEKNVWKFLVQVKIVSSWKRDGMDCAGSILNACYILTAAHCL